MTRMTEVLMKTIIEGHREQITEKVITRLLESSDYEEYIEDRIEEVVGNLLSPPQQEP